MIPPSSSNCRSSSFDVVDGLPPREDTMDTAIDQRRDDNESMKFSALANVASSLFENNNSSNRNQPQNLQLVVPPPTKIHYKRSSKMRRNKMLRETSMTERRSSSSITNTIITNTQKPLIVTNSSKSSSSRHALPSEGNAHSQQCVPRGFFHPKTKGSNNGCYTSTREGFLFRLLTILDDPQEKYSQWLSWMPSKKAFAIRSSTSKFVKSGQLYELFGIRKMSSFLRRLQQLGFCRIQDSTDPTNLDVFSKPGFVSSRCPMDDPRQDLSLEDSMSDASLSKDDSLSIPSPSSSLSSSLEKNLSTPPRSCAPLPSTIGEVSVPSTVVSQQTPSPMWICSTPTKQEELPKVSLGKDGQPPHCSRKRCYSEDSTKRDLPMMPLPASLPGGNGRLERKTSANVVLRPRNESYCKTTESSSPKHTRRASSRSSPHSAVTRRASDTASHRKDHYHSDRYYYDYYSSYGRHDHSPPREEHRHRRKQQHPTSPPAPPSRRHRNPGTVWDTNAMQWLRLPSLSSASSSSSSSCHSRYSHHHQQHYAFYPQPAYRQHTHLPAQEHPRYYYASTR